MESVVKIPSIDPMNILGEGGTSMVVPYGVMPCNYMPQSISINVLKFYFIKGQ